MTVDTLDVTPKVSKHFSMLLPEMSDEEFDGLKQDIAANGQSTPIVTCPDGRIIDGHHRFKACRELKIEPKCRVFRANSLVEYKAEAVRLNVTRRALAPYQLEKLDVKVEEIVWELQEDHTQAQIAVMVGYAQKTISNWLAKDDPEAEPEDAPEDSKASNSNVTNTSQPKPKRKKKDHRKKTDLPEDELEAKVVEGLAGGKTQKEIGDELGISRQRVTQIKKKAAAKIEDKPAKAEKKRLLTYSELTPMEKVYFSLNSAFNEITSKNGGIKRLEGIVGADVVAEVRDAAFKISKKMA